MLRESGNEENNTVTTCAIIIIENRLQEARNRIKKLWAEEILKKLVYSKKKDEKKKLIREESDRLKYSGTLNLGIRGKGLKLRVAARRQKESLLDTPSKEVVQRRSVTSKPAEQGGDTTIKRVGKVLFHPSKSVPKYNIERRIQREERQGTGSKENSWKTRKDRLSVQGELRRVSCKDQRQGREIVRRIAKQRQFYIRLSRVTRTKTRMGIIKLLSAVRREINIEWKPWLKMPV